MTEDKKKKKKGVCSSVTYTTGDPDINIKRMNQAFENPVQGGIPGMDNITKPENTPDNINDVTTTDATTTSTTGDSASAGAGAGEGASEGGSMGECFLDEDMMYATRLGVEVELPKQIHLVPEDKVNEAIAKLEPEEEFTIGYCTPVYFYKEM